MKRNEVNMICLERLRKCREKYQMTQQEVANLLHISQVGYACYETGKRRISVEKLKELAVLYNVSMDYLAGLSNVPRRYTKAKKRHPPADETD